MAREKVVVDIEANVNDLLAKLNIAKRRLASWQNELKDADIKLNANSSVKDLQKALENASTKATADLNRKLTNVAKDIKKGEIFTEENIKSVRPGYGLHPKHLKNILGREAKKEYSFGERLNNLEILTHK